MQVLTTTPRPPSPQVRLQESLVRLGRVGYVTGWQPAPFTFTVINQSAVRTCVRLVRVPGIFEMHAPTAAEELAAEFLPPEEGVPFDCAGAVPLEIAAGSLVLLHAALVHFSEANLSDQGRHAYSIHVVEGAEGTTYLGDNWLQRPEGPSAFPALYDDGSAAQ